MEVDIIIAVFGYLVGFIIGLIYWRIDKNKDHREYLDEDMAVFTFLVFPLCSISIFFIIEVIKWWTVLILSLIATVAIVIYGKEIKEFLKMIRKVK